MVRSSVASILSTASIIIAPKASRLPQRLMLAAQSWARTGVPSWNHKSSRSLIFQVRQSSSTVWPAAICGAGFQSDPVP